MTQPQHCQHECVCVSFIGSKEWTTQIVCCGKRYGDTCKHDTRTHTPAAPAKPVKFPNSTELLLMAHTDWKNQIERKHTHDEIPWTDGWIHGYLTPKPDWKRKEQHDTAIRNAALNFRME